jgi:hypothetical protein
MEEEVKQVAEISEEAQPQTLPTPADDEGFAEKIDSLIKSSDAPSPSSIEVGVNVLDIPELQGIAAQMDGIIVMLKNILAILDALQQEQENTQKVLMETQRGVVKFADHVAKRLNDAVEDRIVVSPLERTAQKSRRQSYFSNEAPGG